MNELNLSPENNQIDNEQPNTNRDRSQNRSFVNQNNKSGNTNPKNYFNDSNLNNNVNNSIKDINSISANNGKSLLRNVQFLDGENVKLRELLSELNMELKDKEEALNESQKIIFKLNGEYSQMIKEYKKLENEKNKLLENKDNNMRIFDNMTKSQLEFDKIVKQNEAMKQELIKLKDVANYYKSSHNNVSNDYAKLEKNNKEKELIIKDLRTEGEKCVNMLQDRDLIIENYSKKINELNDIISQKNQQLKVMVDFSKEINNENKTNVKELTKQAVNTIKMFYNTINNNKDAKNQINFIEIVNTKKNGEENINGGEVKNNGGEIILNNLFDGQLNNEKCSMLLIDALRNLLYIPEEGVNYINKEFLIDNNFKTCLLKTEIFSSLIRENNLFNFLNEIIGKLNLANGFNPHLQDKLKKIKDFKYIFDQIKMNLDVYKKDNILLKNKLNELYLYIDKLKRDYNRKFENSKNKIKELDDTYNIYIKYLENKNHDKPNGNDYKKLKDEISKLHLELDKINNENHNLNEKIIDKDNIISNLEKEIEKLNFKINALRTNPFAEKNLQYLENKNSQSINNESLDNKNIQNDNNINGSSMSNFSKKSGRNKINNDNTINTDNNNEDNIENLSSNNYDNKNINSNSNKKNRIKYYISSDKLNKLEVESPEHFTYFINSNPNNNNNKINNNNNSVNNITSINNLNQEVNNMSKITSMDNIQFSSEIQQNDINPNINIMPNMQSIQNPGDCFIADFKKEIDELKFQNVTNRNLYAPTILSLLSKKIEEMKQNILLIKEKYKNRDKISINRFMSTLDQIEKYISYIYIHINRSNGELLTVLPTVSVIFDLVSKFVYNKPLQYFSEINNNYNITPLETEINNEFKSSNNIIINNNSNSITKTSLAPNIQELKQFFDINKKIFSSSELIKYRNMYKNLTMSQLIKVFKETCGNLKKTIYNLRQTYKNSNVEYSDLEESKTSYSTRRGSGITDTDDYRIVNEKILKLKKFEFDYKILMELLKNYLICFEMIMKNIENEASKKNKNKTVLAELGEEINIIYNLFEDVVYYKLDDLDDDCIFSRKILLKLLQNQKEYLSIVYDL